MTHAFLEHINAELKELSSQNLLKSERLISTPQSGEIAVGTDKVINLCANNYLGLADDTRLTAAASRTLDKLGLGMASVRFICGTNQLHRTLEQRVASYVGQEDAILYAACFDANGGLFEPLFGPEDAIVSDSLNHASIIDGIRLCKAKRYRYANNDMPALEDSLKQAKADGARHIVIATDGVFSMDGSLADLKSIKTLAERYDALVMVDDCHATGLVGPQGRGTAAAAGVKVDLITGTFGKALGGSIGGFTAGPKSVIEMLRQRSRPYLFSNSLPPMVVAAAIEAIEIAEAGDDLRNRLADNTQFWRNGLEKAGFNLLPGSHPIVPVMVYDAALAQAFAAKLMEAGVFVSGFFFPVVPKGQARIRTQMNAALSRETLEAALNAFRQAGKELGVIR